MKLSNNFKLNELIYSSTAEANGINNYPSNREIDNLIRLCVNVLQPIRNLWGKPIYINSGYRNPILNRLVGGSTTSAHMTGCAADITVGNKEDNKKLFETIKFLHQEGDIEFDQLISEKDCQWIHIGIKPIDEKMRNQILYL